MNKRKLVFLIVLVGLVLGSAFWGAQVYVRYQVLNEYRKIASQVKAMNQSIRFEVPPPSAIFKREMLGKIEIRFEIGPSLSFVHSLNAGLRLRGDKPIRVASHLYPDESTAGYLNLHFQNPFSLRTRLRLDLKQEGIFAFHLDPFGTRPFSMGPGVELWITDGFNINGGFSEKGVEAQSDFKDLGFIWRGKGVRFTQGRLNFKDKLQFEGQGVEWFYSTPQGLREGKRVDNVTGDITLEDGAPHLRVEMTSQGKKVGNVHLYSSNLKDWWLEATFGKDSFRKNLDEGWPLMMKRFASITPPAKTLSN